jgi:diguanylate cyclase (GGDEF)-like protein/PAS domain S-box-containing protein
VLWSRAAEQIFGYSAQETVGQRTPVIPPEGLAESQALFERCLRGEAIRDVEVRRKRKDGSIVDIRLAATPMYNPDGKVRGVAWIYDDITGRKKAERQLNQIAHYDQLTGLSNRVSLKRELTDLLSADAYQRRHAVVLFDLDGFKDVNDTDGHSTGDRLLVEVAQRLNRAAGDAGRVYRLGGDEFVVVIPDCGDPRRVTALVEAMLRELVEPFELNEHLLHIGGSAGIAMAPRDGASVDELIANADLALYKAKADGGHTYRLFVPVLRAQAQSRRGLQVELRRAFAENEFELYFQPQIRLADRPWWGPRRCCAGAIRSAAWSVREPSSRLWPRARSPRPWADGSSRTPARRRPPGAPWGCRSTASASTCFPANAVTRRCCATSRARCR